MINAKQTQCLSFTEINRIIDVLLAAEPPGSQPCSQLNAPSIYNSFWRFKRSLWKILYGHHCHRFSIRLLYLLLYTQFRLHKWPVVVRYQLSTTHRTFRKNTSPSVFIIYHRHFQKIPAAASPAIFHFTEFLEHSLLSQTAFPRRNTYPDHTRLTMEASKCEDIL